MKLLFSVPTGYHLRELILPLRIHLESDPTISEVHVFTPAAPYADKIFTGFSHKFRFHENPADHAGHKRLMSQIGPDIVVTDTVGHDEHDYPILKEAAALGITTLTFIASWDNVWKIGRLLQSGKPVHAPDHFIVWNTMMKEHLLRIFPNVDAGKISVIGAPRLDYFWHTEKIPSKQAIYNYLGFEDTAKPLVHVSTTELYPIDYVVSHIAQAVLNKKLPAAHIYASVHPGGNIEGHKQLEKYGATVRYSFGRQEHPIHPLFAYVPTEEDIYMLIGLFKHAAVLVNQSSTTALESLIAGTPVINVKYGRPFDWLRWYRSSVYKDFQEHYTDLFRDDATYVVSNRRQLASALQDALKNPTARRIAQRKTIARMITTTDGTAGIKVLTKIKESASNS